MVIHIHIRELNCSLYIEDNNRGRVCFYVVIVVSL